MISVHERVRKSFQKIVYFSELGLLTKIMAPEAGDRELGCIRTCRFSSSSFSSSSSSSHPIPPSHPIPFQPISSHPTPSHIPSHHIPFHPIPPHSPFPSGTQFRKINNFLEAFSDPLVYGYHIHLCSEEVFFATSKKCVQKIPYRTWDAASSGTRLCKDTK